MFIQSPHLKTGVGAVEKKAEERIEVKGSRIGVKPRSSNLFSSCLD